jgi:hypothetical protein
MRNMVPNDCRSGLEFRLRLDIPETCMPHVLILKIVNIRPVDKKSAYNWRYIVDHEGQRPDESLQWMHPPWQEQHLQ